MPPIRPLIAKTKPLARSLSVNAARKPITLPVTTTHQHRISQQPINTQLSKAAFSTSNARRAANHEDHYDPPSGWLFGVQPGEKYQNEGWENPWIYGFWGSLIVAGVAYSFKPDTSIQTWALEEARRRLEAEGILEDPFPNGVPAEDAEQSE